MLCPCSLFWAAGLRTAQASRFYVDHYVISRFDVTSQGLLLRQRAIHVKETNLFACTPFGRWGWQYRIRRSTFSESLEPYFAEALVLLLLLVQDLDTPALLLDLDALEHNIRAMGAQISRDGRLWRPHCKSIRYGSQRETKSGNCDPPHTPRHTEYAHKRHALESDSLIPSTSNACQPTALSSLPSQWAYFRALSWILYPASLTVTTTAASIPNQSLGPAFESVQVTPIPPRSF
jgi:hypothetical protein